VPDDPDTPDIDETVEEGMTETMVAKIALFEDEMETNEIDNGDDADAVIIWLDKFYEDQLVDLKDTLDKESLIGEALTTEIKEWLEGHVEDLQAALAEICD